MSKHAKILTDSEFQHVLTHIEAKRYPERNRLVLFLSHFAGLRVAEISSLRVGNVLDFAGRIREELTLDKGNTKTQRARAIPINVKLRAALESYLATIDASDKQAPLIQSQKREGFDRNTLCRWFMLTYREAGVDASSHSGRRAFVTNLDMAGVRLRVIQDLVGHAALSTTERYLHVRDDERRKAVTMI